MYYKVQLEKNINRNYLFTFLNGLNLFHGIWMIYLAFKGLSLTQLGILEGVFHLTSLAMEVPTGAVADLYGRKTSRIAGRIVFLLSLILFIVGGHFIVYLVSFILTAISYNLESGAGDALVYDSLIELDKENTYMKINGRQEFYWQFSGVFAFLLGGYLATFSYPLLFTISIVIAIVAMFQSFTFTEPKIVKKKEKKNWITVYNQALESFKIVKKDKQLGVLIIFSEFMMAFATCLFFYLQNYWKNNGYTEFEIGIIFSIASITGAIAAIGTHKIDKLLKGSERIFLTIIPLIMILSIWLIVFTDYSYIFYIILSVFEVILYVGVNDYVNKKIPSENRATIISFRSMVFSFCMILFFPLIGKVGDLFSLNTAFLIIAIFSSLMLIANGFIQLRWFKNDTI